MALPSFLPRLAALSWSSCLANALIVAFVAGLAAFSVYECRLDYEEQARVEGDNLARLLGRQVGGLLERTDIVLSTVTLEAERQQARGGIDPADLNGFLARQKSFLPDVRDLFILDAEGVVRYGAGALPAAGDLAGPDYFARLRNDPRAEMVIGGPYRNPARGEWILVMARRLNRGDGAFAGAALSTISADNFKAMLSSLNMGPNGVVALHAQDMRLVFRMPDAPGAAVSSRILPKPFLDSLKANPEHGAFINVSPGDTIERSFIYRKLPDFPLYVVVGKATQDYLSRWWDEVFEQSAVVMAFSLLVLWLSRANRRAIREQRESSQLLREAVDNVAVAFSIFDQQDRLVASNEAARGFFIADPDLLSPGASFEHIVRTGAQRGKYPEAIGNVEGWVEERIRRHQTADGQPFEQKLSDGRQFLIVEHRTPSGHIVSNRIDITELARYRDQLEKQVEARTAELKAAAARFGVFVEQAPTAIAMLDREMNYLAVSRRWLQAYGRGLDSLAGRNHYELYPRVPDSWRLVHRAALAGMAQEKEQDLLVWRNGRQQWLRWAAYPWRDEAGEIGGIIMAAEDITDRKLAEEQLLESEIRFRSTFEQAGVGLCHAAFDGRFLRVNDKACAILGYRREEMLGLTFLEITHPEDLAASLEGRRQLLAGTISSYSVEKRYVRKDGNPVWIGLAVALVRKTSGEPDYFVAVMQDIEQRKAVEAALAAEREARHTLLAQQVAERTAQLEAANKQLEGFLYAASHDLKGPLGRISNFSTLLEREYRDRLAGDGLLFLDFIRDNAIRLNRLIDDLLNHAQIDQQATHLRRIDLRAAVEAALHSKIEDVRETGTVLRLELPAARILADPHALSQVLHNLLENALKYSARIAEPVIEIGGEEVAGRFRLWVRDNGIGFDMEYHDRIFEIFRRLHTYAEYAGSGVGLALVKRAMERMGGKVWAESEPGQGAVFYLEFQMDREAVADLAPA